MGDRPGARDDRPGREERRRDDRVDERAPRSYSDVDAPLNDRRDYGGERRDYDRRDYDRRDADRREERPPDFRRDDGRGFERRPSEYERRAPDHDWRERKEYGRGEGSTVSERDTHRDDRRGGYDRY